MYVLLRQGKIQEFNQRRAAGETCRLQNTDLRGLDLRGMDARDLDLSGVYLRQCDLRGVDLSTANLEGASISGAKISGTYFPKALDPAEINLSLVHGTRMRYR
jgi:uncharacterized protein YjbI with pentapeptide repeats